MVTLRNYKPNIPKIETTRIKVENRPSHKNRKCDLALQQLVNHMPRIMKTETTGIKLDIDL